MIRVLRILELFNTFPLYKWVHETASEDSFVSTENTRTEAQVLPEAFEQAGTDPQL
jgi:hypothetical protein